MRSSWRTKGKGRQEARRDRRNLGMCGPFIYMSSVAIGRAWLSGQLLLRKEGPLLNAILARSAACTHIRRGVGKERLQSWKLQKQKHRNSSRKMFDDGNSTFYSRR